MVHPLVLPLALLASSRSNSFVSTRSFCTASRLSAASLPSLLDVDGTLLAAEMVDEKLKNKRVAYYFAAGWCPMCTSFEPTLLQFREAAAESGKPIELIYVSSDRKESDMTKRAGQMQMMSVPYVKADELKKTYNVWAGSESMKFGFARRSGVPAIVVLDQTGEELAFVPAESQGVKSLQSWPIDDSRGIWGE